MAQIPKDYEVIGEFNERAARIVEKYPDTFGDIDIGLIRCYGVTNKPRNDNKIFEVKAVVMPIRMDCEYGWYGVIYSEEWNEMDVAHKNLLVAKMIYACGDEEGKIRQQDYKDFDMFLMTQGIGPHAIERDDIVDILDVDVDFKTYG